MEGAPAISTKKAVFAMLQENASSVSLQEVRSLVRQLDDKLTRLELSGVVTASSSDAPLSEHRLEQLAEFASTIIATLEVDAVMDKALSMALRIVGAEHAFVQFKDSEKSMLEKVRGAQKNDGNLWAVEKIARSAADRVFNRDEEIFVPTLSEDAQFSEDAEAYGVDIGGLLCLPLKGEAEPQGAFYLDRKAGAPFSSLDFKIAKALASITFRALANAKTVQEQNDRRQHLEMINKLYRAMSRNFELDQMLDQVAQITLEVTKAERSFIMLMSNDQLTFGAGRDKDGPLTAQSAREVSRSVCQKVLQTQQGVYVFDTASDAEFSSKLSVVNLRLNSVVAVPLKGHAGMSGLLYIDSKTQSLGALEKEMAVLTAISNVASLAIENAKLYRQATLDGLTGLYVRTFFMMRLDEEAKRCGRYGRQFSLLVMDIDHFKKFNDSYGHQTGDEVIKLVAGVVKRTVRTGVDFPGRYGGEELVLVLPETNTEGALIVADRIRQQVESTQLQGPKKEVLNVTISIGVATFPMMGGTAVELFAHADQALYSSKQNGRNRCTIYSPEEKSAPKP
jgi:diguanylate cyclase (GGDEF)-like protein